MISFITSLYKSEKYLKKYLSNIEYFSNHLKQKGIDFEFIIISNNPNGNEKNILNKLTNNNKFVKLYFIPRESLYASWNRGISLSRGEIIGFWNVDDKRYPKPIFSALKLFSNGTGLIYFPFIYKRYIKILNYPLLVKKITVKPPIFDKKIFTRGMYCGPFFMFTKKLFEQVGPFDKKFKIAGDFDWCVRAAKITNFSLCDEIAGEFRNEGTSLSGSKNKIHQEENKIILDKNI